MPKAARNGFDRLPRGSEVVLVPGFRKDLRGSLYRMIAAVTEAGLTIFTTVEPDDPLSGLPCSNFFIPFLTDDIIQLCSMKINCKMRKMITTIRMRGENHSTDIREDVAADKKSFLLPKDFSSRLRTRKTLLPRTGTMGSFRRSLLHSGDGNLVR